MDLNLGPRGFEPPAEPITATVIRELTQDDRVLMEKRVTPIKTPALKRITERHHKLARCIASGMKMYEAARTSGYCVSRVSILLADPAFKELVEAEKQIIDKVYGDIIDQAHGMSFDAATLLRDRMEDDPSKIPTPQLLEIMKAGMDRTGHGPSTTTNTNHNVTVNIAARTEAARKRLAEHRQIDITPTKVKEDAS